MINAPLQSQNNGSRWEIKRTLLRNFNRISARATNTCYVPQAPLLTRLRVALRRFVRSEFARSLSPLGWITVSIIVAGVAALPLWRAFVWIVGQTP